MVFSLKFGSWLFAATAFTTTLAVNVNFNVEPFVIDLASEIPRLNSLVNNTRLPTKPLYPSVPDKGIELDLLSELRSEWLGSFDWETQQAELNQSVSSIIYLADGLVVLLGWQVSTLHRRC